MMFAPHSVMLTSAAQRSSIGTSHVWAAGLRPVVPLVDWHCRKPAQGTPLSSTVTKPEHGPQEKESMPSYVS